MKALIWIVAIIVGLLFIMTVSATTSEPEHRPLTDREIIEREADRFCDAHPDWEDCR